MLWFFHDPLYLIATAIGLVLSLWAQFRVKSAFARFAQIGVALG